MSGAPHDTPDGASAHKRRWLRPRILVPIALLLLVAGSFESYRAWTVVRDLRHARSLLQSGQSQLETHRLDATSAELTAARADFDAAGATFSGARSRLEADPAFAVARRLPFVSSQAGAALSLTRIGNEASAIGAEGIDAAEQFNRAREQGDQSLLEKSQQIFDGSDPHIAAIQTRLDSVDAMRGDLRGRSLLPPMRAAIDDLDRRRARLTDFLDTYHRARAFAPGFLGFDGPRTYLVLAQNNAEMMPTGGLVSVVGTIRLDHGRIERMEFQDAVQFGEDWMARTHDYVDPPKPLRDYLLKDTSWNLLVSNWSPDFPTSAKSARRFWELGGGEPVDGVVGINVTTLERLLEVTGPVDVPEFDVTVDARNAFDLTEQYTRAPYEPQADRKAFAALLADEVLRRVLHPEAGQWSPLVDTVQRLGDEKDVQIYAFDPKQEELIKQWGWDGSVDYRDGDYLMLVDASVNSTKLNAVVTHRAEVDVRLGDDGRASTTLTLDYVNDLKTWEKGRDPDLVYKLMVGGMYGGYVRLLTPPGSRMVSVRDRDGEVGLDEISREKGLSVFGRYFALPRDTRQHLVFSYITPPIVEQRDDGLVYRLNLKRQPGWGLPPVFVRVTPPAGMRSTGVLLDGASTPSEGAALAVDLTRDRILEFHFEKG